MFESQRSQSTTGVEKISKLAAREAFKFALLLK
jgi:hypothetical protein